MQVPDIKPYIEFVGTLQNSSVWFTYQPFLARPLRLLQVRKGFRQLALGLMSGSVQPILAAGLQKSLHEENRMSSITGLIQSEEVVSQLRDVGETLDGAVPGHDLQHVMSLAL